MDPRVKPAGDETGWINFTGTRFSATVSRASSKRGASDRFVPRIYLWENWAVRAARPQARDDDSAKP
jgi:hypothetical protein